MSEVRLDSDIKTRTYYREVVGMKKLKHVLEINKIMVKEIKLFAKSCRIRWSMVKSDGKSVIL